MFSPKLNLILTPRSDKDVYSPDLNEATLTILSLIFEFKLATAIHITRFLGQKEVNRYLYTKLRRLWQGGILESLQLYHGTRLGMPLYYMLSKEGFNIVAKHHHYDKTYLKTYPSPASFISSGLFQHEAEIVELASLEALAVSDNVKITFIGEVGSLIREARSDKRVEVLTPDYTMFYTTNGVTETVYTEFERSNKSIGVMMRKIERYDRNLEPGEREHTNLRLIFDNERMERSFWLHILLDKPHLARNLRIVTTNLALVQATEQFLEVIYATEDSISLKRDGRVMAEIGKRGKLFEFI
jgi:hypothetical protein